VASSSSSPGQREGRFASIAFLIETARPGLWATSAWFYLLPLGRRQVFGHLGFWIGLLYVTFPLGLFLYGWNDLADADIDRFNPRKGSYLFGARGSREQLQQLPFSIAAVQLGFLIVFWYWTGLKILIWFTALVAVTTIYNLPRFGLRTQPPFDILNQAGYLLVFVLSSWLNAVPQLSWQAMLFGALFAMHSHVFGEVMDLVPDQTAGRRSSATVVGMVPAKFLISAMLAGEAVLIFASFHDRWIAGALAFGAMWFVADATVLWGNRPYSLRQMRTFMLGWNAIALASMSWVWFTASLVS
jgi:4-hydroxybenzoate polyprenyltransferase